MQHWHHGAVDGDRVTYFSSGLQYFDGLASGEQPELLQSFFQERVAECNTAYRHEEFITVGLFDDLAKRLSSNVAFALIPAAVDIAIALREGSLFDLAMTLVADLARASEITEMPPELDAAWISFEAVVTSWSTQEPIGNSDLVLAWEALGSWYRRH